MGSYPLLGEFYFRRYPSDYELLHPSTSDPANGDRSVAIDGPAGEALFAFAEEHHAVFQIHYEVEDALLPPLEKMLDRHPGARAIWAHFGRVRYPDRATLYTPAALRRMLGAHPNLYFDTSCTEIEAVYPGSGKFESLLWDRTTGTLLPDWRQLVVDHPWRFLSALDLGNHRMQILAPKAAAQREFLAQLPTQVREIVAYKAAWKLLFDETLDSPSASRAP